MDFRKHCFHGKAYDKMAALGVIPGAAVAFYHLCKISTVKVAAVR